jgi:hypothetical protein
MKRSLQLRYLTLWEELYTRYIDSSEIKVHAYPESVAPAFYYNNVARDGSNFVSIDIGGGTSDVVIYKADDERMKSNLHIISSFRFAGNTIFGDGFTSADADHNPLIEQYADYFSKLVRRDSRLAYLDVILRDIIAGKRSEDINAFLFSIENAELLHNLSPIDRRAYSYNALLGNDECRKVIFVYFLTAIIYYVARLMHDSNLEMPKQICFSGTGSKILNIVGRPEVVEELARDIIEKVYGRHYGSFELKMERQAPKQITCKGGIELQHRIEAGKAGAGNFASREIMQRKFNSTLTPTEAYTYSSIRSLQHRSEIEEAVKQFNTFFLSLLTNERRDELGIPKDAADYLSAHLNDDISSYLAAGIEALLPLEEGSDEAVEDVPFFYPIAGIIRNNLIMNLRPGKLKRAADPQ